ncbi:MAG: YbhB/YbcL family Raf kinase inhibitor-like protein [archaeon]|nr:YbhB/YbcL family Raf kinase inhibitor-like protein [archaeon]
MESGFTITSTSFKDGQPLPKKHAKAGQDVNPQLAWTNPPAGTKSFALINDDPDAPCGVWTHWLVKDIPATMTEIKENSVPGVEVESSWGFGKYCGPSPPSGTHRYYFKLYALKVEKMKAKTLKAFYAEVEKEKLGVATIMGTYKK